MKLNQLEITVWLLFANLIRLSNAGLSKSVNGFVRDSGEEYQVVISNKWLNITYNLKMIHFISKKFLWDMKCYNFLL